MVNEGTAFSKRSTWWDAIFMCFSSRNENVAGTLIYLPPHIDPGCPYHIHGAPKWKNILNPETNAGMLMQLLMRFVMNFTIGACATPLTLSAELCMMTRQRSSPAMHDACED